MRYPVVLSVLSRDRVGIISGVTQAIYELNGNIDAISQTVMRGYFTIILTVDFPETIPLETVRDKVAAAGRKGEMAVSVQKREAAAAKPVIRDGENFVLTIIGKDRPGIASRITSYLASRSINIIDLSADSQGEHSDAKGRLFTLIGQLTIPHDQDIQQIQIDLKNVWKDDAISVTLQHENIFVATNEIDFHPTRKDTHAAH